jgi:hypothetical protein
MSHNHKNVHFEFVSSVHLQNIHAKSVTCDVTLVKIYMQCMTTRTDPRHVMFTLTERRRNVNRDTRVYPRNSEVRVPISSINLGTK